MHAVHTARKDLIEVRHQLDIVAIEATDIFQAVAETLPTREMLLEYRKTAREWMTAHIDDLGFRQREYDQAQVQKVVGCFIDKEWRSGFTLYASPTEIFLTEFAQSLGRESRDDLRIAAGLFLRG